MSESSEVLYGAADHIEAFGHHKGGGYATSHARTAAACTIGAIIQSSLPRGKDYVPALDAVKRHLAPALVVDWNDAPERTPAEVVEVLRATAVIEAAREQEAATEVSL